MLRHSFSFLVFIAHFVFLCFCKLKHVFGQSPQIPDICTYAHCGTFASIIGHLRLFSEHLRPLTDSHVCFRSLPCIFSNVSNFEHLGPSHNNSVRISTLASVWLPFRNTCSCFHVIPSTFGQLSPFWQKNQNDVLLGCFTVKTQRRKGKKENCTLNPHSCYESLSIGKRKDPGGEGGGFEHLYLFVCSRRHFVSTEHAQTLHVISMYLWTGYFAPNRPLEKEKKTYIYINKAWIKRPQKLTLPEPAQISSA